MRIVAIYNSRIVVIGFSHSKNSVLMTLQHAPQNSQNLHALPRAGFGIITSDVVEKGFLAVDRRLFVPKVSD